MSFDECMQLYQQARYNLRHGHEIVSYDDLLRSLSKCRTLVLENDVSLTSIYKKLTSRPDNDRKIAPGSSTIKRNITDKRYLLSMCCVQISEIYNRLNNYQESIKLLQESLIWWCKNIEAICRLTNLKKSLATTTDTIDYIEYLLKKAIQYSEEFSSNTIGIEKSIIQEESHYTKECYENLILLLCQQNRNDEVKDLLLKCGYTWRLSPHILYYQLQSSHHFTNDMKNINHVYDSSSRSSSSSGSNNSTNSSNISSNDQCICPVAHSIDHAVTTNDLQYLKQLFRPKSPFWSEHDYDAIGSNSSRKVGYFSYLYPFQTRSACCDLERLIDKIYTIVIQFFPHIQEKVTIAEWWVHSRVHSSGHQLHFDSDETNIENGGIPVHPLVSCVLFVQADVGGPTLVTNQLLSDNQLQNAGWLYEGKSNRLLMFDAKYLHGVIPGHGITPDPTSRRLTFMVGFWEKICAYPRGIDQAGPGQPLPDPNISKYIWIHELLSMHTIDPDSMKDKEKLSCVHSDEKSIISSDTDIITHTMVIPKYVPCIWEPVCIEKGDSNNTQTVPHYQDCFQGF